MSGRVVVDAGFAEPLDRLSRDLRTSAVNLTINEVRYLVNLYFTMQENRKSMSLRSIALGKMKQPHEMIDFFGDNFAKLERTIKNALSAYMQKTNHPAMAWLRTVSGVGPVIACGLFSEIKIERAHTAGSLWRYAGLDPTIVWNKGQKRPFNADLKLICYYAGEAFVKQGNFYRMHYAVYRDYMEKKNEHGDYAKLAQENALKFKWDENTVPYKMAMQGKLADSAIFAMSRRWVTKLFLAHLHAIWRKENGLHVPEPYAVAHLGHAHIIHPVYDDREVEYWTEDDKENARNTLMKKRVAFEKSKANEQ